MIVKITAHRSSPEVVVVHAGPELADFMGAFPAARWQPAGKVYWLPVEQLDAFTRYARIKDHTLVDDRAKGPEPEKFTGPLPECAECGGAATRQQALALKRCPRCGAVWRPLVHADTGPVGFAVECAACGRRQRAGHAYCGGCGAPVPAAPTGPRPVSVPRPQLAEPALFGDEAPGVVDALEPDHMQRAAGDR